MPAALCPLSAQTQFDAAGRPLLGGKVYAFAYGTTTLATVYADAELTTALPNPVPLTAAGRVPPIFLGDGTFSFRIVDAGGGLIDFIAGIPGGTADSGTTTPVAPLVTTGMLLPYNGTGAPSGWVRCNGQTIGADASGATELASSTASNLFQLLWNETALKSTVSSGPGISAASDFAAGKTIQLPNYRGRAAFGVDGMGAVLAGVLTAATTATPDAVGTLVGAEGATLTATQLPAHTHAIAVTTAGGHTHAVATESAGAHAHNITVNGVGDHSHTASTDSQGGHSHTGTTDNQGGHTHPGSTTDNQGSHTHSGSVDAVGDHGHGYTLPYTNGSTGYAGGSNQGVPLIQSNNTNPAGAHTHTYTTPASGSHSHTPNLTSDGVHSHNLTIAAVGGHTHNVAVNNAGAHTHTASADTQGAHTHVVDVAAVADHTHVATAASTGGADVVSRIPPAFLATWLIKL